MKGENNEEKTIKLAAGGGIGDNNGARAGVCK